MCDKGLFETEGKKNPPRTHRTVHKIFSLSEEDVGFCAVVNGENFIFSTTVKEPLVKFVSN